MSRLVKCLVWDLDDTLWDGVVLEGDRPRPFPAAVDALHALDRRGILHAVAGRGDRARATAHLAEHALDEMFCAVAVGWGAKSAAIRGIAADLNIGLDTVAFIDNDPVERAEVTAALPMVRCYAAERAGGLAALAEFRPEEVTDEARLRRRRYLAERDRAAAERVFPGSPAEFLTSLELTMTVRAATEDDFARAHELTVRTHQLNTTGRTLDAARLRELTSSERHEVLVVDVTDRFGGHGTVGLAVLRLAGPDVVLELLLTSCRVLNRGVGALFLGHLVRDVLARGRRPVARFVRTSANRIMLVTLRFAGFEPAGADGAELTLAYDPRRPPPPRPAHVRIVDGRNR
ncbi:HAD-IIIC family phosphatase [Amycolatopsis sp. cmx-4-61]|uniref:HAD-IIIC family phosphatase n=1 Tax=Amycolatopsis sp. cmx-4-61 TaxID=2790937 RepID=UPI00397E8E99